MKTTFICLAILIGFTASCVYIGSTMEYIAGHLVINREKTTYLFTLLPENFP